MRITGNKDRFPEARGRSLIFRCTRRWDLKGLCHAQKKKYRNSSFSPKSSTQNVTQEAENRNQVSLTG